MLYDVFEFRGAGVADDAWVEVRHDGGEVLDHLVCEDVLGDGDEERAAKGLGEHHDGGADGDVGGGEDGLYGDEGLLHAETYAGAEDELVPDPFGRAAGDFERAEETGADGHEDRGYEHEGGVVAEDGDEASCKHGDDD